MLVEKKVNKTEDIVQYRKDYYQANKEKLKEFKKKYSKSEKCEECGLFYQKYHKKLHVQTLKHKKRLNQTTV
jgi:hypothetical protein